MGGAYSRESGVGPTGGVSRYTVVKLGLGLFILVIIGLR